MGTNVNKSVKKADLLIVCHNTDGIGENRAFEIMYEFDRGRIGKIEDVSKVFGIGKVMTKAITKEYVRLLAHRHLVSLKK